MAEVFGFDEAVADSAVLVNSAGGIEKVYGISAEKIKTRASGIAGYKGLQETGAGISGIKEEVDGNGFRVGWVTRPNLHLYFHEIGTYKDPPRPHLRPAVDELEEEIYQDVQNKLTEGV